MRCGNCGNDSFTIYQEALGLFVKCTNPKCDCEATIRIRAELSIKPAEKSSGNLAVF